MRGPQITIIGAGSAQFSGGIVRDLCVCKGLHGCKLVLMDVDEDRLNFISAMAKKLTRELDADITIETTMDRVAALDGADFVINTAQDGGHGWANAQRRIFQKYNVGAGAAHMVGSSLFLVEVAKDIEKYCPTATLIQSGNPVFEGCTAITRQTKVRTIGLCHGHYGYRDIAKVLGLDLKDVSAKMYGFNHWIWMTDFRYKGEDAYPLIDKWIEEESEEYWKQDRKYSDQQMSRAAIEQYKLFGLVPIGDTPRMMDFPSMVGWVFNKSLEDKIHWYSQQGGFDSAEGWQQYLDDLQKNLDDIRLAATDPDKKVSDLFPPIQSDEQIVPIIDSLIHDKPGIYQVNIPNKGQLVEGFPEDIVVECQAVVDGSGVHGIHMGRLPSRVMAGAMNPRFAQAEIVEEVLSTGSYQALRLSLLMDHNTKELDQVDKALGEWLSDPRNARARDFIH